MRLFAVLPVLTAVLAAGCALWPPARRFIWPVLALAAINVVLTPLTSGEWFYQREEDASYEQAVARGDFTAFDGLVGQHDPRLQPVMVGIAVALLVALVLLAVLHTRGARAGQAGGVGAVMASAAVLLAAAASVVQAAFLLV